MRRLSHIHADVLPRVSVDRAFPESFLRGSGHGDKQLRNLGHDLEKCVAGANASWRHTHFRLSEADIAAIAAINPYYQSKDLQYSTWIQVFSTSSPLISLAERLWEGLRPFCEQQRISLRQAHRDRIRVPVET